MVALNFKAEFADAVADGRKCQTIRAYRKDGRRVRVGQTLQLYTGMRTKSCRKLGDRVCSQVRDIKITDGGWISLNMHVLTVREAERLAAADGFKSARAMVDWFAKANGLPFQGLVIKWDGDQ